MTPIEIAKERLQEAKRIPLLGLLKELGYELDSNGSYYTMLSPFRSESVGSFKINKRKIHKWEDHGNGKFGDVVDFVMELFPTYSLKEAVDYLLSKKDTPYPKYEPEVREKENIEVLSVNKVTSPWLIEYLAERKITQIIAFTWLVELEIRFPYGKHPERVSRVLGFKNDSGGYEMRSKSLKLGNKPKNITTIHGTNHDHIRLYEGFFNFLSDVENFNPDGSVINDCIVLNSLSFLPSILPFLKDKNVLGYLDNDRAGNEKTALAKSEILSFTDMRYLYSDYNDLNDMLTGKRKIKTIKQILNIQ